MVKKPEKNESSFTRGLAYFVIFGTILAAAMCGVVLLLDVLGIVEIPRE